MNSDQPDQPDADDPLTVTTDHEPETGRSRITVIADLQHAMRYGPYDIAQETTRLVAGRLADEVLKEHGELLRAALTPERIVEETLKALALRLVGSAATAVQAAIEQAAEKFNK